MFIYQETDIDNLINEINSLRDINIDDIKNSDYLLINIDETIVKSIEKIPLDDQIQWHKHEQSCPVIQNIANKYKFNSSSTIVGSEIFTYTTEPNLGNTLRDFKNANYSLNVEMISKKIQNNTNLPQDIRYFGKLIYTGDVDEDVFLCSKSNVQYLNTLSNKKIIIVDNTLDRLNKIYNYFHKKYPNSINNIKLYLYNNEYTNNDNNKETMYQIEKEYCSCEFNGKLVNDEIIKSHATHITSLKDINQFSDYILIDIYSITHETRLGIELQKIHNPACDLLNYLYFKYDLVSYLTEDATLDMLEKWKNYNSNTKIIVYSPFSRNEILKSFGIEINGLIKDNMMEKYNQDRYTIRKLLMDIFFNHNPNAMNQTLSVIFTDPEQLSSIYKYYKKHNSKNLDKLHLYLYTCSYEDRLQELTDRYCDCRQDGGTQNVK